jgi:hypothetical protein
VPGPERRLAIGGLAGSPIRVGVAPTGTDESWRWEPSRGWERAAGPRNWSKTMRTTVVRYQAKPERADENQQLIEAVFAELNDREPEGFTYKVFRLEDGVSFIHVVIEDDIDEPESLQSVPAFQAFVAEIADRCDVPPVAARAIIVGGYR